jgi:hypothetical protein
LSVCPNKSAPLQGSKTLGEKLVIGEINIAVIQKFWVYGDKIRGLCN